ncbi:hypothetical protein Bca101_012791 [Brassica carinata]
MPLTTRLSTLAKPPTRCALPSRARRVIHSSPRDPKHHIKIQNVDAYRSRRGNHRFAGSHRIWSACTPLRRLFFHGELHRNFSEISSRLEIDTIRKLLTTPSLLSSGRPVSPSESQPEAKPETTTETQLEHHKTSTRAAVKMQRPFDAETKSRPFTLIG